MFKQILIAAALAVSVPLAANAADPYDSGPSDFNGGKSRGTGFNGGFYGGVYGGYDWAEVSGFGSSIDGDGFGGGVTLGYDWSIDNIFFGFEVRGGLSSVEIGSGVFAVERDASLEARMRGGLEVSNRALVYLTAGIMENHYDTNGFGSDWDEAWSVGLGAEFAMTQRLSAALEYDYIDYLGFEDDMGFDFTGHRVNLVLRYRFGS